jgi:drug/metabolite transporter (DMT)-like permease
VSDEDMIGELAALGAAICWAIAPIFYRQALFQTSPISANIVRCATNAAVMMFVLLAFDKWNTLANLPASVILITVLSGFVGLVIGDTLYMKGLQSIGVSRAVPLAATYPLFSLVWATFLLGEPVTATIVAGAVTIVVGIWLLSSERNHNSVPANQKLALIGIFASLTTAVIWSVSLTLMNIAVTMPGVNNLDSNYAIITLRIASMALFLSAFAPFLDRKRGFLKMKRHTIIWLCLGGLVANGAGWLLMNYSFLSILEAQAVPISSITPLFSAFAGFILFHEKATLKSVLGAAMIVIGVILIFIV